jgi:hypothetical protein
MLHKIENEIVQVKRLSKMGCPALGVWVAFLKQPALPVKAPPKKNLNH